MKGKIYISSAISGDTGESQERKLQKFYAAEVYFGRKNYMVVNPLDVPPCGPGSDHTWECFMKHDIQAMMTCDTIAMLPGWHHSKGAIVEHDLAVMLGFTVIKMTDENMHSAMKMYQRRVDLDKFRDTMGRLAKALSANKSDFERKA